MRRATGVSVYRVNGASVSAGHVFMANAYGPADQSAQERGICAYDYVERAQGARKVYRIGLAPGTAAIIFAVGNWLHHRSLGACS